MKMFTEPMPNAGLLAMLLLAGAGVWFAFSHPYFFNHESNQPVRLSFYDLVENYRGDSAGLHDKYKGMVFALHGSVIRSSGTSVAVDEGSGSKYWTSFKSSQDVASLSAGEEIDFTCDKPDLDNMQMDGCTLTR